MSPEMFRDVGETGPCLLSGAGVRLALKGDTAVPLLVESSAVWTSLMTGWQTTCEKMMYY